VKTAKTAKTEDRGDCEDREDRRSRTAKTLEAKERFSHYYIVIKIYFFTYFVVWKKYEIGVRNRRKE
jgi:hypothetical protein